ncbi:ankyrin repeat domain-containing protein [Legionella sp. CNM-1927-20]|uniref:ankyrin repeat domain-containing protein n=1 Tax=Legionella sp. CNM-1927-20 TaxID=3422221 RepID=UPI00403AC688
MPNVTDIMVRLGYNVSAEGVCFGYKMMRTQAVFIGRLQEFNERIKLLNAFKERDILLLSYHAEVNEEEELSYLPTDKLKRDAQQIKYKSVTDEEKKLKQQRVDMLAFFGNIALHQMPSHHRSWLTASNDDPLKQTMSIETVAKTTASRELEARGNIKYLSGLCSQGSTYIEYDINQLESHLADLQEKLKLLQLINSENETLSREIVLSLGANGHGMSLQYNPKLDEWTLTDINLPPDGITYKGPTGLKKLADDLINSDIFFNKPNKTIKMQTIALLTGDYAEIAIKSGRSDILSRLESMQFDMSSIHQKYSLSETLQNTDPHLFKFLLKKLPMAIQQAIYADDYEQIKKLAQFIGSLEEADVRALLQRAAFLEKFKAFRGLVESGVDLSAADERGNTPIHLVLKSLNQSTDPFIYAPIQYQNEKQLVMDAILEKISPEHFFRKNSEGISAFDIAFSYQDMSVIIRILLATQDLKLLGDKIKVLHLFRDKLTNALIDYVKGINNPNDKIAILDGIYTQQNALGTFLNTPKDRIRFFFTNKKYDGQKVTGSIEALHLAFPKEDPAQVDQLLPRQQD